MSVGKMLPPEKPTEEGVLNGSLAWYHTGTQWQGYFEWEEGGWSEFRPLVPELYATSAEVDAEEKLAKILDLMHPGYWGTYDYRREAILKVIDSGRTVWNRDPYEEMKQEQR